MNRSFCYPLLMLLLATVTVPVDARAQEAKTATAESSQASPDVKTGSLQKIPQTAGFYFSTMNHAAVKEAIVGSNAWKSIKASDVSRGMKRAYRRGRTRGYEDYNEDNPFSQALKAYGDSVDNMIFKSIWQIVGQVFENELFVYVDNDVLPVLKAAQQVQLKMIEMVGLEEDQIDDEMTDDQARKIADMLDLYLGKQECPTIIMGSRLNNPEGFRGLLELGRSAAEQGMRNLPPDADFLRQFWKVVDEDDHYLLMADINLSRLPWHEILEKIDNEDLARSIENVLSTKRATVAVGIIDNLLVFGVARDHQLLVDFGTGPKLIDQDELAPLAQALAGNRTLVNATYMSKEFADTYQSIEESIEAQKYMIRPMIELMEDMPAADRAALADRIENELTEFVTDLTPLLPTPGMTFGFATLEADGLHGYAQKRSVNPALDGSKPLNLAKHANANTLAFFNQRLKNLPAQYDFAAKWGSRLYGYGRDFGLQQIADSVGKFEDAIEQEMQERAAEAAVDNAVDDVINLAKDAQAEVNEDALDDFNRELRDENIPNDDPAEMKPLLADDTVNEPETVKPPAIDDKPTVETVRAFLDEFELIAARFDEATRKNLLPAIDGQEGSLFMQMSVGPNPWHPEIPVGEQPLPFPLPVLMLGHDDAPAVLATGQTYWTCTEELLESLRTHFPDSDLDEFVLPQPDKSVDGNGTSFRWNVLSKYANVDPAVRMGALVSKDWIVMNFLPTQAIGLTEPSSASNLFGPAATDKPSVTLVFYDHRVLMRDWKVWLAYAEDQAEKEGEENLFDLAKYEAERDTLQFTEAELRDALQRVWTFGECFKGVSARSYLQDDATVTDYLLKFQDLPAAN